MKKKRKINMFTGTLGMAALSGSMGSFGQVGANVNQGLMGFSSFMPTMGSTIGAVRTVQMVRKIPTKKKRSYEDDDFED